MLAAGVDDVDQAAHADVEHQIGLAVEKFRAVDESEVMHLVHALGRGLDRHGVADIAGDELDLACDSGEPARRPTRIVVKYTHLRATSHQRLYQRGADEAAAAGDKNLRSGHAALS